MPGKREDGSSYTYISTLELHRTVSAADLATQVAIEAIAETIELGVDSNGDNVSVGAGNKLTLGVLFPAAVTAVTAKVFVNMKGTLSVANYWAEVDSFDLTNSAQLILEDVYPAPCKVAITSLAGSGDVEIVFGRTL